jgi:hypothetical protein
MTAGTATATSPGLIVHRPATVHGAVGAQNASAFVSGAGALHPPAAARVGQAAAPGIGPGEPGRPGAAVHRYRHPAAYASEGIACAAAHASSAATGSAVAGGYAATTASSTGAAVKEKSYAGGARYQQPAVAVCGPTGTTATVASTTAVHSQSGIPPRGASLSANVGVAGAARMPGRSASEGAGGDGGAAAYASAGRDRDGKCVIM